MKRLRLLLLFVLLSFCLSACGSDGLYQVTLLTNGEHVFDQDLAGDLIMIGGSATLPAGKYTEGQRPHLFRQSESGWAN